MKTRSATPGKERNVGGFIRRIALVMIVTFVLFIIVTLIYNRVSQTVCKTELYVNDHSRCEVRFKRDGSISCSIEYDNGKGGTDKMLVPAEKESDGVYVFDYANLASAPEGAKSDILEFTFDDGTLTVTHNGKIDAGDNSLGVYTLSGGEEH